MNWKRLLAVSFVPLLVVACGGSGDRETAAGGTETVEAGEAPETAEAAPSVFEIGDSVDLGEGFSSVVLGVKTQPTAGKMIGESEVYFSRAAEGSTFVVVEFTVTNNGPEEEYFLFSPQLADAAGTLVDTHVDATTNYSVHELVRTEPEEGSVNFNSASTYSPGEYKTKAVVFEVDQAAWDAGGWTLLMEDAGVVAVH